MTEPLTAVHGWIGAKGQATFDALSLVNDSGVTVPLRRVDRPDVQRERPDLSSAGFTGWLDIRLAARGPWLVRYMDRGRAREADVALSADDGRRHHFIGTKIRKLAALRPLLRCPDCLAPMNEATHELRCENGHSFGVGPDAYDFLTEDTRDRAGVVSTDNVSAHGYDQSLLTLIDQSDGPILDVGAGLRREYREDVINLEIVPYPTTDVLAIGESLPFADATFGMIISVATLEHVRDPFATAREQVRVLRSGGRIFAAVPFLQPYHGYPSHYYNMTADGLQNLFPELIVERLEVPAAGHPIFALSWILASWKRGLPARTSAIFEELRVRDLIVDPATIIERDFVTELDPVAQNELAALNVLVARKP